MNKETETLRERIATYLTTQFIGDPEEFPDDECLSEADQILQVFKETNGVFLDPDQSLPKGLSTAYTPPPNFKKIKEIDNG